MSAQTPSSVPAAGPSAWPAAVAAVSALVVVGGPAAWAVRSAPPGAPTAVAWWAAAVAVALVAAATAAAWQRDAARRCRERADALAGESADLAHRLVPALVERLRAGSSSETALAEVDRPANPDHDHVLRTLAEEVGRGERARAAAMAACGNAAGRMQALATTMLADLREMEERHGEEVLGDLLELDHSTAQAGRLADSIAVLTGSRSGRRWTKPIVMESILRGAVGRVSAYQRVRTHSASSAAIVGYAAEGVMHALAELIDNACGFSPPSEQVHVYVEEVQAGVVVTIEDGGLVMGDLALRRAERTVAGGALDLTELSGTRLGLAVVGRLARKHGLTVSFRPSSRGGTGVVVMIPRALVTEPRPSGGRRRSADPSGTPTALPVVGAPEAPAPAVPEQGVPAARQPAEPTTWHVAEPPAEQGAEPAAWQPAEPATWQVEPWQVEPGQVEPAADTGTWRPAEPGARQAADAAGQAAWQPADQPDEVVLPRRRRGSTLGSASSPAPRRPAEGAGPHPDAAVRFSAFRNAGRPHRDARPEGHPPENHGPPDHGDATRDERSAGERSEAGPEPDEAPRWPS
ncbi:ATP-binding protein [Saccharothrix algeriensis]|uniref:histidine kinase n=2 Tax=Saccharothrix algeriensis TaxID=173560 RepID=A0ABS2SFP3_9PSEU|nr:ATP-binding protein [Saccharothrix algeriensis]MBM7815076.1 signal transduction histidine kinase [Saccharothrix algeriensis]